ncbi:cation-transporting P-type ATPase [Nitrosomonas sp. Nm132]|uniref:cation-translocating P-type ATPase n=1 Tax=Nitrosomonas sp. Nm132 TaxID=1881053 RepID=UPI000885468C|nr:cation-transporting P-type ATPase [Nitrosomonas sp. Nm132]SDH44057.1 plasma-membrane calcium-translocating P-type ATPase [Nitrosomonas sp. Nm132]
MRIHKLSPLDAVASLKSTAAGLSRAEVERRLHEFGRNEVEKVARGSVWLRLIMEFSTFFSVILWVAAALAFFAEWSEPGQGMAKVGYAIVTVILVSGLFSFWQEYRVERTLAALRKLLPQQAQVLREGKVTRVPAEQLVPGDIIHLEQGNNVPADCRLIEAFGARVNNAAVTGESLPKAREAEPSEVDELIDSKNVVLAGTSMVSGQAKAVVFATGMHTEFGKIAHLTQTAGEEVSPLRKEIAHLSRLTAILAVLIGLVFFSLGWMIGIPFWKAFIFTIGIIVAMMPEGLLPTLTLALVLATQRMAKRNVLIRYLPSVETLGSTTVICTDKTGTLTLGNMMVRRLYLGKIFHSPTELKEKKDLVELYQPFFLTALMCHDLKEAEGHGKLTFLGDPMEVALVEMALNLNAELPVCPKLDEIPFETDRMRLSTIHQAPEGAALYCKGAPESVLPLCQHTIIEGKIQPLDAEAKANIVQAQDAMAQQGLRVLAFAYKKLAVSYDREKLEEALVFTGLVGLEDPPRPEVPEALRKCQEAGIKVIMVTGDHPRTATAIAREIGLVKSDSPTIITGEQLRRFSVIQLQLALDAQEVIFARVVADQKMRIVEALRKKQQIVAVTGDGVNDAPALKAAHIGIAMGIAGTDVAKEAADMVLLDDNFASIVNAVEEGRAVFENIRRFLTYVLVHNVAELIPYLGFLLFKIPLALTPIQALSIDMGSDTLTALGLGAERPNPQIMRRPPRSQNERLMNWSLVFRAYFFLGLIEATAAMAAFFFVLNSAGWAYGQNLPTQDPMYMEATTACLSTIIVMQIVNVFLCRSATRSVFSTGLSGNTLIIVGVILEIAILLLINYTPWGNSFLGTASIGNEVWGFIILFAAVMFLLEELRKWLARKRLLNLAPRNGI